MVLAVTVLAMVAPAACSGGGGDGASGSTGATTAPPSTAGDGVAPTSPTGVVLDETIEVDGLVRRYRLVVPASIDPATPAPLVLVLHGNGTDRNTFPERTGMDAVAEREGFLAVYPDAEEGTGGVWNGGFSARTRDIDDVSFLRALVEHLAAAYPVDPDRVYATGLSGGGMMSYRLACEAPDLVAAIAPVGATMVVACDPEVPVSVLHLHGVEDRSIPFDGREDREFPPVIDIMEAWATIDGCDPEPDASTEGVATITTWTGCEPGIDVELRVFEEVGHEYPRADQGAPVDARELVWTFFADHPRAG